MRIDIEGVLANIKNYDDWDYKAYTLQKDEAETIVEFIENNLRKGVVFYEA